MGNCLPFLRSARSETWEQKVRRAERISLIEQLPMGVYNQGVDEDSVPECMICLEGFVPGNNVRCLPCMHLFHVDCIDAWLMRGTTCPCCRWQVLRRQLP